MSTSRKTTYYTQGQDVKLPEHLITTATTSSGITTGKTGISQGDYATHQLDGELRKNREYISLERVKKLVQDGADLYYTDEKGDSFSVRAGLKLRYDVVDYLNTHHIGDTK